MNVHRKVIRPSPNLSHTHALKPSHKVNSWIIKEEYINKINLEFIYIYIYDVVKWVCRERFEEIGKKIKRELDAAAAVPHQQMGGRRHMLGAAGTLNTITPCAACKLLRRRCAQECPFSPYFSPHEPHKFASVHKVFGASNVSKMLMVYLPN